MSVSDAERALYREHGELASRMCLHGLTEAEASRLEAVRSALDEIEMRKMGPGLERLQARADAVGELRDKVLALVAELVADLDTGHAYLCPRLGDASHQHSRCLCDYDARAALRKFAGLP